MDSDISTTEVGEYPESVEITDITETPEITETVKAAVLGNTQMTETFNQSPTETTTTAPPAQSPTLKQDPSTNTENPKSQKTWTLLHLSTKRRQTTHPNLITQDTNHLLNTLNETLTSNTGYHKTSAIKLRKRYQDADRSTAPDFTFLNYTLAERDEKISDWLILASGGNQRRVRYDSIPPPADRFRISQGEILDAVEAYIFSESRYLQLVIKRVGDVCITPKPKEIPPLRRRWSDPDVPSWMVRQSLQWN